MSYLDDENPNFATPKPRNKGFNWTCLILILLGVGGGGILLCCGGGAGLMYFGVNMVSNQIQDQLKQNETFREHIGEIQSFTINLVKTGDEHKDDTLVYDVKGTKGSGEVVVTTTSNDEHPILSAVLRLPDGTAVTLIPEERNSQPAEQQPAETKSNDTQPSETQPQGAAQEPTNP